MADIKLYGRLWNATTDGVIASATQVKDEEFSEGSKFQHDINEALLSKINENAEDANTELASKQDKLVSGTNIKTINGTSILGSGNIAIDLSLYKVVTELPTSGIDTTKIYLLLSSVSGTANKYTEYIYVNSAWEKVGEYKAEVDLTPYAKKTEAVGSVKIEAGTKTATALNYNVGVNTVSGSKTSSTVTIPAASTSEAGLLSAADKTSLDTLKTQYAYADALSDELLNAIFFNLSGETTAQHMIAISTGNNDSLPGAKGFFFDPEFFDITYDSSREYSGSIGEKYPDTIIIRPKVAVSGMFTEMSYTESTRVLSVTVGGVKKTITIPEVSSSASGLMTKDLFTKLNGIAAGATADSAISTTEIDKICV